ncbi:MAG: ABC transporter permease, partial [Blastocatellia bacterium]
ISTIATPVVMLALALLPGLLLARGGGVRHVTFLDQSGDAALFPLIKQQLDSGGSKDSDSSDGKNISTTRYELNQRVIAAGETLDTVEKEYQQQVQKDADSAYVVLPASVFKGEELSYYSRNVGDFSIGRIEEAISSAVSQRRLEGAGLQSSKIAGYLKPVHLKTMKITSEGQTRTGGGQEFMISFVLLFFLYLTVLFYGMFVMRGVIEEKQSRIVEIMVSSVNSTQMMFGKLIGIGLVGLTQVGIWALFAFLLTKGAGAMLGGGAAGSAMPAIPVSLLIYFLIYFVLGYFLFSTLYALVGSTVSGEEEAQQAQWPVTGLLVVPMMIFGSIVSNPNSTVSVVLSLIPFFSPTLMMMRISLISPPFWQILLSIVILLATICVSVWIASRIYRVGILMYGKRPSITELGRWLRYNN